MLMKCWGDTRLGQASSYGVMWQNVCPNRSWESGILGKVSKELHMDNWEVLYLVKTKRNHSSTRQFIKKYLEVLLTGNLI